MTVKKTVRQKGLNIKTKRPKLFLSLKIKELFVPYVIISVGLLTICTFLNWLLIIRFRLFNVNESLVNILFPFILSVTVSLFWLRPKLRILNLRDYKRDKKFLYLFIAIITIAIPSVFAQLYIDKATSKLITLDNIDQIDEKNREKYYQIKNYDLDFSGIGISTSTSVTSSGKYRYDYNMYINVVIPITTNKSGSSNRYCKNWLGIEYEKSVNNNLPQEIKEEEFQEFINAFNQEFDINKLDPFLYLKRVSNSNPYNRLLKAIQNSPQKSSSQHSIFLREFEPFEGRNLDLQMWILKSWGIGCLLWFLMLLFAKVNTPVKEKKATIQEGYDDIHDKNV